jgi:hypothetical protein
LTAKRAAFLSEHALTAPHSAANSDELDEELVDKVKGEQGKVAGEVVLQHDAAMRSWSISRSAREKLGGLFFVNPACAKK